MQVCGVLSVMRTLHDQPPSQPSPASRGRGLAPSLALCAGESQGGGKANKKAQHAFNTSFALVRHCLAQAFSQRCLQPGDGAYHRGLLKAHQLLGIFQIDTAWIKRHPLAG